MVVYGIGGLWISKDQGATYEEVNVLPDFLHGATVSNNGMVMYAIAGEELGGVYKSTDSGATWTQPPNRPNTTFTKITANGGTDTTPGGQFVILWSTITAEPPFVFTGWGTVSAGENWSFIDNSYGLSVYELTSSASGYLVTSVNMFQDIYTYTPGCPTGYERGPYDVEGYNDCIACEGGYFTNVRPADTDTVNTASDANYDACIACPIGATSGFAASDGPASCKVCPYPTSTPHSGYAVCSAIWLNVNGVAQFFFFTALCVWLVVVIMFYSPTPTVTGAQSSSTEGGAVVKTEGMGEDKQTHTSNTKHIAIFLILGPPLLDFLTDVAYLLTSRFYNSSMFILLVLFFLHPVPMFLHRVYKVGAWYPAMIDNIFWLGYSTSAADAVLLSSNPRSSAEDSGDDVSPDHVPYPTVTIGPTTSRFVLIVSINSHDNIVGLSFELLTWFMAILSQLLTFILLPVFVVVWLMVGCLFQMTKTITMTPMWDYWFEIWTNSKSFRDVGEGGVDTHMLNYALLAQFVLETLPNIVIQPINNTLLGTWVTSSVAILSFSMSCLMLLNVLYKYTYHSVLVLEPAKMRNIPIDKTVKISFALFSFNFNWTLLDAKLEPYMIATSGYWKRKGVNSGYGGGYKPLLVDCEEDNNRSGNGSDAKYATGTATTNSNNFPIASSPLPKSVLATATATATETASENQVSVLTSTATATATMEASIPHECICPISHKIMIDPVICSDGYTYDRQHLIEYLESHDNCSPIMIVSI